MFLNSRVGMSDDSFIREVEEELRTERLQNIWNRYGKLIIGSAVIIVAAVAGYRYYEYSIAKQAAENGDAFMQAVRLTDQNKRDEALTALENIGETGAPTYKTMASMRLAAELAKDGKSDEAVKVYDAIIADASTDEILRSVSRIRAAMVLVDSGSVEDVEGRVQPLLAPGNSFASAAREAVGLAFFKAANLEEAFKQFDAIASDVSTPSNMRQRAGIILSLIASRGGPVRGN